MAGFANKGLFNMLGYSFVNVTVPTNYYVALVTSAVTPDADTNTLGQLTQIAVGNGYVDGGYELTPGATDFDVHTENDTDNRGEVQIKDLIWTASGGPIPATGDGARWAILTDDNATVGSREVMGYFDLTSDQAVSDGQTLTVQNMEMRLSEA